MLHGEGPLLFPAGSHDDAAVDVVQPRQVAEFEVLILDERLVVGDLAGGEVDAPLGRDAHRVPGEVVLGADGVALLDEAVVQVVEVLVGVRGHDPLEAGPSGGH